jgi:UDP:flavonoid glycosyltransferase YjiC (YdhE family)
MRICVVALGTHGDVRPLLALAEGLSRAGDQVVFATHRYFEKMVADRGLGFRALEVNPRTIIDSSLGRGWLRSGTNPFQFMRHFRELALSVGRELTEDCFDACRGAEAIVTGLLGYFGTWNLAERLEIPLVAAFLQPATPSRYLPSVFFHELRSPAPVRRLYNHASHHLVEFMLWSVLRTPTNRVRATVLNLPPARRRHTFASNLRNSLMLYGFSPAVLPRPADWNEQVRVTGYWFLDGDGGDWQPSAELERFLGAGTPPAYVGFGSMSSDSEEGLTGIVFDALRRCGLRGVLATGWGGLSPAQLPPDMLMQDWVPHDWLFPRTAAVIHHGGAGTTATALRHGVPQVVVPFFGDQHFWGHRVHELGAGPRPVPRRRLTADGLADALRVAVSDRTIRDRAGEVSARIRAEDGVTAAVQALRGHLRDGLSCR